MSIMSDEMKHLKDQVKGLETQLKVYENHLYILQNDLQYTQKNLQLEQAKQQNQITSLASLVLDVVKENRQYEEQRENNVLQKINNIINLDINDYSGLNTLSTGGSGVAGATSALGNDASLINGITLNSSTQGSNTPGGGTSASSLLNPRISNADQLLTSSSLQAPSAHHLQQQAHQPQQQAQMNALQQSQMAAIQQSFQQQHQHHRHQRNIHLQSQNSNGSHHFQPSQFGQRLSQPQSQQQPPPPQQQQQPQQAQTQSQSQEQQQLQQQQQQQQLQQQQKSPHTNKQQRKKRKTNIQDPSSLLEDPLNYSTGQSKTSISSSRHVPLAMNGSLQPTPGAPTTPNAVNNSLTQDGEKRRKTYDKEYSFIKAPNSVEEVWNEYAVGLNGQPSIKSLELEYKTGWRRDPATSKKFNRRKAIYHGIERGLSKGYTVEYCIELLEDSRYLDREKNTKQPIGWLCHGNLPEELR